MAEKGLKKTETEAETEPVGGESGGRVYGCIRISTLQQNDDRLGRDFNEILEQWRVITLEKKCGISVLDMKILDTDVDRGLLDRLVSEIMMIALSYVAQLDG